MMTSRMSTILRFTWAIIVLICYSIPKQISAEDNIVKKTIKVGVYENHPKIFINKKGKPDGIFIDIVKSIAKNENLEVKYVFAEWPQLMNMLNRGEIDVLPDMAYSPERDSMFTLSKLSVLGSWFEVFTTSRTPIESLIDLRGKKIGVLKGSIQEEFISTIINNELGLNCKIIVFKDYPKSIRALKQGDLDAIIASRFFYFSELFDKEIVTTGVLLKLTELHFAFQKNKDPELVSLFDKNIAILKNNPKSDYYKSLQRWFSNESRHSIPEYVYWLFLLIGVILSIVTIFAALLRYEVKIKTKTLKLQNDELIKAKGKAEESEKKLQLITDNVHSMIYQISVDKNNTKQFTYLSKTVEKFYGHTAEEVKANSSLIYGKIFPLDLDLLLQTEAEALAKMEVFQLDVRMLNPDGSIRWSHLISSPQIQNDFVIWDGIEMDISHLKHVEEELILAKEKAEESNKLKTVFLQNMSHEIRTPMNGILGFINLLKSPNIDAENNSKYIDIINKSSIRLLETIDSIVEISKIESNQVKLKYTRVTVSEMLEFHFNFFKQKTDEKNIQLKLTKQGIDNDTQIETDEHLLNGILTNLINNAIKFTDKGSVELGSFIENNEIVFFVKDTGIGIPEDRHDAIFERFVQADLSDTRPHEGSGLGLAIVKAYSSLLNGKLRIDSSVGKGTTFYISLPYKSIESKKLISENIKTMETDLNKEITILIAEDDEMSFLLIETLLKNRSCKILRATNGNDAINLLKDNPEIQLILMDIKMQKLNGIETTKKIREFNKTIPIIAQTAYAMTGDMEIAIEAGCNEYLTKPINTSKLIALIAKYTA